MATAASRHAPSLRLLGRAPRSRLMRLQSDERLVALVRMGNYGAFEVLVGRYHQRLLSFCRYMTGSAEDAEDVVQEVFAGAYAAMVADDREIHVRAWLYGIARNACLKQIRASRTQKAGPPERMIAVGDPEDSRPAGPRTTEDEVAIREDVRMLVGDMLELPEAQRMALVLWAVDARSYRQTAEVMDTSVASVKSLLVRARLALAEAAEARELPCESVEFELAEAAQGIRKVSRPARRHARTCERCQAAERRLAATSKALAALSPGPLALLAHGVLAKLGLAAHGHSASAGATAAGTVGTAAASGVAGQGAATAVSSGLGALATKAAAGFAAATLLTAGTVEVSHLQRRTGLRSGSGEGNPAAAPSSAAPPARLHPASARTRPSDRSGAGRTAPRNETSAPSDKPVLGGTRRGTVPGRAPAHAPAQRGKPVPVKSVPAAAPAPQDAGSRRDRPTPEGTSGVRRNRPQPAQTPPDSTSTQPAGSGG